MASPWQCIIHAQVAAKTLLIDTVINSPAYYYAIKFNNDYTNFFKTKRDTIKINKFLLERVKENIDNPFSLWVCFLYLNLNQNRKEYVYDLKKVLAQQGSKFSWFRLYPGVIERVNNILSVDRIAFSDFKLFDKRNRKVSLTLGNADYYVLDFWFLACAPCRQDHKMIKEKKELLEKNGIQIISISSDKYSQEWKDYLVKNGYDWPNYLQSKIKNIADILNVTYCPYYVVLKKDGYIVGRYNSFDQVLNSLSFTK